MLLHGVDVLLSSSVNNIIYAKKTAKADAKCQQSCLSKIPKVQAALRCRDSEGLNSVSFSIMLKYTIAVTPEIMQRAI